jgi:phage gp45-like
MRRLVFLAGLIMLSGCGKAPDNNASESTQTEQTEQVGPVSQDPNVPDSYGVVKVCGDGTEVYLLNGGAASGQYAIWNNQWELLAPGATPESVCAS